MDYKNVQKITIKNNLTRIEKDNKVNKEKKNKMGNGYITNAKCYCNKS